MSRRLLGHDWKLATLRQDASSALVILLLGLPLSLGAALASGAPPTAGLVAAAVAGLVCGAIGGAPMMVTGPVVALATLSSKIVGQWGLPVMCAVTLLAGILQLGFAALRLGRWSYAIMPSVLEGMLAGIGITLMSTQALAVLGRPPQGRVWNNLAQLPSALGSADLRDLAVAAATIGIALVWNRTPMQRALPSMLVSLALVSVTVGLWGASDLRFIEVPRDGLMLLGGGVRVADLEMMPADILKLAGAAVELALVCSVYSLLSAASIERLVPGTRTRLNLELAAQGLANSLSALLGGLPVSGAVLRSSANLRSGAASSLSLFLQGALMVLALTHLRDLLRFIPISALAATFLHLGLQLVRPARLRHFARQGELSAFLATALGVIFINLFVGVLLGLAVATLRLIARLCRLTLEASDLPDGGRKLTVTGVACFFHVPRLLDVLQEQPDGVPLTIGLTTFYCDPSVQQAVAQWCDARRLRGQEAQWLAPQHGSPTAVQAA